MNWSLLIVFCNMLCEIVEVPKSNTPTTIFIFLGGILGVFIFMLLYMGLIKLVNKIIQKRDKKKNNHESQKYHS